jgi:hypothetical protein
VQNLPFPEDWLSHRLCENWEDTQSGPGEISATNIRCPHLRLSTSWRHEKECPGRSAILNWIKYNIAFLGDSIPLLINDNNTDAQYYFPDKSLFCSLKADEKYNNSYEDLQKELDNYLFEEFQTNDPIDGYKRYTVAS